MDLYTLVTNIGKAKIANAAVLGKKVDFSKLKVGDGNGNYYEPSESQTNLVHKVWEGNVNNVLTGGEKNPNWIVVQTMIPPGEGGFYIRECGLFDEEDNLLAISKYPESYKPTMDEGSTDDLTIELIFEVSNAATINLKIDPLVTLASLQNLYDLESKINKKIETLSTRLNDLTSDSYPIVEATGTNAYIGASARIKAVGKGTRCTLFVGTASNGNCSLNLNNSGAVAIKDSNGNVVTNMKANIPYNLCHNGSDFILQGKGGGGNLIPKYLLAGYYGEGDNGRVDGAMVNRGAVTQALGLNGSLTLPEGYYNSVKIAQTIPSRGNTGGNVGTNWWSPYNVVSAGNYLHYKPNNADNGVMAYYGDCWISAPFSTIANILGITGDKVVAGNNICGVQGAATIQSMGKYVEVEDGSVEVYTNTEGTEEFKITTGFRPRFVMVKYFHSKYNGTTWMLFNYTGDKWFGMGKRDNNSTTSTYSTSSVMSTVKFVDDGVIIKASPYSRYRVDWIVSE